MGKAVQIEAWRQRLKEIKARLYRAETLSLNQRERLKKQVSEIELLIQMLER